MMHASDWLMLLFSTGLGLLALGALAGPIVGHKKVERGINLALSFALTGSVLVIVCLLIGWLVGGLPSSAQDALPVYLTRDYPAPQITFALDNLSGFFLLLSSSLAAGVSIYSFGWLADKKDGHRIAGAFSAFVFFTLLLLLTSNLFYLLVFMECASLAFSYLALYRHNLLRGSDDPDLPNTRRAFIMYLVLSHVGLAFLLTASVLLAYNAGDFSFRELRAAASHLEDTQANLVFLLVIAGISFKGGFIPAHFWVSVVHPKSPTTTHALTLGIVIKVVSIYPMLRYCFEFLANPPWWWGMLMLLMAGATAIVGVLYAIAAHDLKTALASHSVENIGIMLAGFGLALLFRSVAPALAGLALIAGFYHLLNHTLFKSLLYLCTASIEQRTKSVDLDELGGVIRYMPLTASTFLIGSLSIAGFPPFNGFVSEWLTLQAIFAGIGSYVNIAAQPWIVGGLSLALVALASAFAMTVLAFTKIAGLTLLGVPRHPVDPPIERPSTLKLLSHACDEGITGPMCCIQLVMAGLCLLLGLFPGLVVQALRPVADQLLSYAGIAVTNIASPGLDAIHLGDKPLYQADLAMLPIVGLILLPLLLGLLLLRRRPIQHREEAWNSVWNMGAAYDPRKMQITSGAYASLLLEWINERSDGKLAKGRASSVTISEKNDSRNPWELSLSTSRYARDYFQKYFFLLTDRLVEWSTRFGSWAQNGDIRWYLAYLFTTTVLALVVFSIVAFLTPR